MSTTFLTAKVNADTVSSEPSSAISNNTSNDSQNETKQVEIAVYLYNKRGAEGQIVHNENGINRTYESADVPESLMRGITPYVGVI